MTLQIRFPTLSMKQFPIATASVLSRAGHFRAAVFAFILSLAAGSARGETADERVATLSTKLGELLAAKPGDAGNTVSAFSNNIVKRAPEVSLASRLDDEKLIRLAAGLAAAIPGEKQSELQVRIKSRVAKEALDSLRAVERSFDGIVQSSDDREAALTALTTAPVLSPLLKIIRNPDHDDSADALIGIAIIIKSRLVEGRLGTAKANGSESTAADGLSTLPHIRQHGELCVPTCGLMSLGHLAGVAFDSSMLDSLGDLYHRRTGNGTMGSSPQTLYPLLGLDATSVDYAEGRRFKNPDDRVSFTHQILSSEIKTGLARGDFFVFLIRGDVQNHAVLIVGTTANGDFVMHDPMHDGASAIPADVLARRWYIPERDTLAATSISFPNLSRSSRAGRQLPDKLGLEITDEAKNSGLSDVGLQRRGLSQSALQAASPSFRWADMTSTTPEERHLRAMDGIPLVIKIQLLAGLPVKTVDEKGGSILITGYEGGLKNPEATLHILTKAGERSLPWSKLLKEITVRNDKGKETVFLGFWDGKPQSIPGLGDSPVAAP